MVRPWVEFELDCPGTKFTQNWHQLVDFGTWITFLLQRDALNLIQLCTISLRKVQIRLEFLIKALNNFAFVGGEGKMIFLHLWRGDCSLNCPGYLRLNCGQDLSDQGGGRQRGGGRGGGGWRRRGGGGERRRKRKSRGGGGRKGEGKRWKGEETLLVEGEEDDRRCPVASSTSECTRATRSWAEWTIPPTAIGPPFHQY